MHKRGTLTIDAEPYCDHIETTFSRSGSQPGLEVIENHQYKCIEAFQIHVDRLASSVKLLQIESCLSLNFWLLSSLFSVRLNQGPLRCPWCARKEVIGDLLSAF